MRLLLVGLVAATALNAAAVSDVADAAERRDTTALHTLIGQHARVNDPQADGTTALHWAAHWNDLESFTLLLRAGADAKAVNRYGATPLSEAATAGNAAMVAALLKAGADPNTLTTADGETVLMTAARASGQVRGSAESGDPWRQRQRARELSRANWAL